MPSVLIVCTGNICRSPMAEALLRRMIADKNLPGTWQVGSAGTWTQDGEPASENGILAMVERGLDTSRHRSRMVSAKLMAGSDLVLTMTGGHAEAIRAEFPNYAFKVHLLTEMSGPAYDVQDPYRGPLRAYQRTADEIEGLVERGVSRIIELAQQNSAQAPIS